MFWAICNLLLSLTEMLFLWISTFCFMKVNDQTLFYRRRWYGLSFFAACIAYCGIVVFCPENWISILLQILLTMILGFLLFHRKALPLILDLLFSVVLLLGMEGGIFLCNIILHHTGLQIFPNMAAVGCVSMVCKLLVTVPLAVAMIVWRKSQDSGTLTLRQTLTVLVLPAFSIFFFYSLAQMCTVYVQLHGLWLLLGNIAALLLLNVYFLYLFRYLFRVNKLEQEQEIARMQSELQYRHYEELEQKYRESRKILHDMKNHLQAVEQLYGEGDSGSGDNYVQNLYHMINILGEKYYSSNHMLNIILNEKLSQAQAQGIQVKAEVGDADFDDLQDMDITTIFANLLDNAIEAAGSSQDGFLELKIDRIQDFRVIRIRNSKNLSGQTAKSSHMGLGLVNVRQALSKYHGSLEQQETEKEYGVDIMIPGKE